jgi:hypothetical protein
MAEAPTVACRTSTTALFDSRGTETGSVAPIGFVRQERAGGDGVCPPAILRRFDKAGR